MGLYRKVQTSFWSDTKVIDDFTPEDKYFYLYLLTNSKSNLCGCFEISIKKMASDLGYSKDSVENLLNRFQNVHKVIKYDKDTKEIIILNWYKHNWTNSPKFKAALKKEIDLIKSPEFAEYLFLLLDEDFERPPEKEPEKKQDTKKYEQIKEIVDYLNEKCNTRYRHTSKKTIDNITARLNDGYTLEDFKIVIDKKTKEWTGTQWEKFLTPLTLFSGKFESYLNQNIIDKAEADKKKWVNQWRDA